MAAEEDKINETGQNTMENPTGQNLGQNPQNLQNPTRQNLGQNPQNLQNSTGQNQTTSNSSKCRCESCNRNFETLDALEMHNSSKHYVAKESTTVNYKKWGRVLGIIAVVMLVGFLVYNNNSPATGAAVLSQPVSDPAVSDGDIQKVTLSFKDFNYYPNSITVKAGIPVEITLDKSIGGCFRSFNIKDLGVRAYSGGPSETIKFTPTKRGTFEFACGMRMGVGKINVV